MIARLETEATARNDNRAQLGEDIRSEEQVDTDIPTPSDISHSSTAVWRGPDAGSLSMSLSEGESDQEPGSLSEEGHGQHEEGSGRERT